MKPLTQFRFMLWSFGKRKVPLISYVKPKLMAINDQEIIVKIPCTRRNKNHLNSMYFGALNVGADLAGGFHALYHAKQSGRDISLAFKSFHANFLKRPESDVYFVSQMGDIVKEMIATSQKESRRVNHLIEVKAYTHYPNQPEEVANFSMELSLKVI